MSSTETIESADAPITRRDLVEGRVDKIGDTEMIPMSDGDLDFNNFKQMIDYAKVISTAGPILQPWLQGNVGGVLTMMMRAKELGISFLTLQGWSYVIENKGVKTVAFMAQYFTAVINARAPIKDRLHYEIIGEGEERRCRVWATLKGETTPREFLSDTLANLRPAKNEYGKTKGSPLWDVKPDLQMYYNTARDFARVYFADVLGGVYGVDEMEDVGANLVGPDRAIDVSPKLRERLRGPSGEGFQQERAVQSIEASIAAASTVDDTKNPGKQAGDKTTAGRRLGGGSASDAAESGPSVPADPPPAGTEDLEQVSADE